MGLHRTRARVTAPSPRPVPRSGRRPARGRVPAGHPVPLRVTEALNTAAIAEAARAGISLNRDLATDLAAVPQYWRSAIASGPLDMRAPIGLHCSPIGI
jgi:hypothetical protein